MEVFMLNLAVNLRYVVDIGKPSVQCLRSEALKRHLLSTLQRTTRYCRTLNFP